MTEHIPTPAREGALSVQDRPSAPTVADKIAAAAASHRAALDELADVMIRNAARQTLLAQIPKRSFRARAMGEASPYGMLGFAPVFFCDEEKPPATDDLSKMTADMLAAGMELG